MRCTYLGWLAAFTLVLTNGGRTSAQNPLPIPVASSAPAAVLERTDPPDAAATTPPMQQPSARPGAPGAYQSLQSLGSSPCETPAATPPAPPPFGGPPHERPKLLGDWGGARTRLRDCGVTLDVSSTNFYSGVAGGGLQERFSYRGRADYV